VQKRRELKEEKKRKLLGKGLSQKGEIQLRGGRAISYSEGFSSASQKGKRSSGVKGREKRGSKRKEGEKGREGGRLKS